MKKDGIYFQKLERALKKNLKKRKKFQKKFKRNDAHIPDRTEGLFLTMEVLYQLSYVGSSLI